MVTKPVSFDKDQAAYDSVQPHRRIRYQDQCTKPTRKSMPFYCIHLRPCSDVHLEPSDSAPHIHEASLLVTMAAGFLIRFGLISKQHLYSLGNF